MLYLGTSGWYYDHWAGDFYPEELDKREWLQFYAKKFNTVEVNTTFYRMPFPNMLKGWKRKTPENFMLSFKGSSLVTHKKKLQEVNSILQKFYSLIDIIKEKRGVILWQLPPSLHKNNELLEKFLNELNLEIPQAVEFRHKSWYEKEVYRLLEKYGIGYCIISFPSLPTQIEVTAEFAYIRWHGKESLYSSNYSKEELEEWAEVIRNLDVKDVYGYFNNDFNCYAPKNCEQLKEMMED
ncbi:MAG: DUF72 domain-containing protein [Candidatus Thermoplasmatota archaeon]|nr:DUF72 domain-containing protein [Candidatus Thermoplasmatota archaeon]